MEKVGVVGWYLKVIKVWWISKREFNKVFIELSCGQCFFQKKSKIMIKFIQRLKNMILWLYLIASICQVFINFFCFQKEFERNTV